MSKNKKVLNAYLKKRSDELRGSVRPQCEQDLSENPAFRSRREESFKEKARRKERKHKNKMY